MVGSRSDTVDGIGIVEAARSEAEGREADGSGGLALAARVRVWKERGRAFSVTKQDGLRQKISYMHNNPVRRKLVETAEQWEVLQRKVVYRRRCSDHHRRLRLVTKASTGKLRDERQS